MAAGGDAPSVASGVPGLPAETAAHIGLTAATPVHFFRLRCLHLDLVDRRDRLGHQGTPAAVVPKVLRDPSYSEMAAGLFLSGAYVLYFPDLTDMPEAFHLYTPLRPGMSGIDTDLYR